MAQNNTFQIKMIAAEDGTQNGQITMVPSKARAGVFEYLSSGFVGAPGIFPEGVPTRLTASVRSGNAANFVTGVRRIKRRAVIKVELPISVPGADGDIIDYINVDFTLSNPVEATPDQIATALNAAATAVYALNSPLKDVVEYGREPY